ncbi:contractile injection system protein, VgrG/Pvc8 family [Zooshikella ganghwensis]|uniref:contractile injection system protein, VgrG/Pvc8 family n=1 Tax=Zooshikella ganghwensis TaxID=202772 RepID=UPI00041E08B2|nr:contractile injection system protein, VgrG/Pvc8 family [Zooshikella ganghwensis]
MGLTPWFNIIANNTDITQQIKSRLLNLQVVDCAGFDSDMVSIQLDDRDHQIALPSTGAKLNIALGYNETGLVKMGLYVVDELTLAGPPWTLGISAKVADMRKEMKAPKTKTWQHPGQPSPEFLLTDIVKSIAARYRLKPRVSKEFQQITYAVVNQTEESDLHFLSRLAKEVGAIAKPAGNYLLFVKRGQGKSVSGNQLPAITLTPPQVSSVHVTMAERSAYQRVIAKYQDQNAATTQLISAGKGEPCYQIRKVFKTAAEAQEAARARLASYQRGEASIEVSLPGNPGLIAEADVHISGFREGIDGIWSIERVTHSLSHQGYVTTVEAVTK